jgi:hypothetical protein
MINYSKDLIAEGGRCAWCAGSPHPMRDCPACGTKEEMEEYIKRMNKDRERLITALAEICDILPWDSTSARRMLDIAEQALAPNN